MTTSEVYHKVIPSPKKPDHLPYTIYWLSGEGCGSWFHIVYSDIGFVISRYSPDGKLECKGLFYQVSGVAINLNKKYEFTYLSHCAEVNMIQDNQQLKFKLIHKH